MLCLYTLTVDKYVDGWRIERCNLYGIRLAEFCTFYDQCEYPLCYKAAWLESF
ncbi:hypothetical protein IMCC3135_21975 [Granulosicoccus antarcticus IMCC3135]|uniref:Uncharacterized protein n=1 Tax=Granulosicoccus antarcticus IMCC3135 TaxID=1192854 RepID=A0A2Z2P1V3_9GAMM|nr:hypothetical protein IMCC3135_21975 [Granulosicoccus antarcticus IMCC3135]